MPPPPGKVPAGCGALRQLARPPGGHAPGGKRLAPRFRVVRRQTPPMHRSLLPSSCCVGPGQRGRGGRVVHPARPAGAGGAVRARAPGPARRRPPATSPRRSRTWGTTCASRASCSPSPAPRGPSPRAARPAGGGGPVQGHRRLRARRPRAAHPGGPPGAPPAARGRATRPWRTPRVRRSTAPGSTSPLAPARRRRPRGGCASSPPGSPPRPRAAEAPSPSSWTPSPSSRRCGW